MADPNTPTDPTASSDEPASFSPASAKLAVEELFEAIPRTRRGYHVGAFNEALVVIEKLAACDCNRDPRAAV